MYDFGKEAREIDDRAVEPGPKEAAERDANMRAGAFARPRFGAAHEDGWKAASKALVRKVLPKR